MTLSLTSASSPPFGPSLARGLRQPLSRLGTDRAALAVVNATMRVVRECHKVFRAIIILDAVDMMNVLIGSRATTIRRLPHDAMFPHIPRFVTSLARIRMFRPIKADVAPPVPTYSDESSPLRFFDRGSVSMHVAHGNANIPTPYTTCVWSWFSLLAASALAQPIRWIVRRGPDSLLALRGKVGRLCGLRSELMAWNKAVRRTLLGNSLERLVATTSTQHQLHYSRNATGGVAC